MNLLNGKDFNERKVLNSYYDSRWGLGLINLGLFILKLQNISSTKRKIFNIKEDPMEIAHIDILTTEQRQIKSMLKEELENS